jgi:hypothetical protein
MKTNVIQTCNIFKFVNIVTKSTGTSKKDNERDLSMLKIVSENGDPPNKAAKSFFKDILNPLVNDLFDLDKHGQVTPIGGMDYKNDSKKQNKNKLQQGIDKLKESNKTKTGGRNKSAVLAQAIFDGIYATNQNKPILFRVTHDKELNTQISFDRYDTGLVDLIDFQNLLHPITKGFLLGHIMAERFSTPDYEDNKKTFFDEAVRKRNEGKKITRNCYELTEYTKGVGFYKYHQIGIEKEIRILEEMKPIDLSQVTKRDDCANKPDFLLFGYSNDNTGKTLLIVTIYTDRNFSENTVINKYRDTNGDN